MPKLLNAELSDEMKLKFAVAKTKIKKAFDWAVANPIETAMLFCGVGTVISACGNARNNKAKREVLKAEAESKRAYARYYNSKQ